MNWSEDIILTIGIAFLIEAPLEMRLKRIQDREIKRFGERVLSGGDMYSQQEDFRKMVIEKNEEIVYASAQKLKCPVIMLNGTKPVDNNIQRVLEALDNNKIIDEKTW